MHIHAAPGGTILAIAAHPDDIESWCAGTLAQAYTAGARVDLLLVTSGDAGSADPADTHAMVRARREAEAQSAAAVLGIATVRFLRSADGEVVNTLALRAELVRVLRLMRPDVVFTHDPERPIPPYLCHPDHRAVGRAVLDAVYPLARDRLALPSYPALAALLPHQVKEIWLFASGGAETLVDISTGFDQKIAARLAHVSQTGDAAALRVGWQARAAQIGEPLGLPLAEAFTVLQLDA
jgi:LmbE family N-acetylglucosaminyl deacetylase